MDRRTSTATPVVGIAFLALWALVLVFGTVYSQGIHVSDWLAGFVIGFALGLVIDRLLHVLPRLGLLDRRRHHDGS